MRLSDAKKISNVLEWGCGHRPMAFTLTLDQVSYQHAQYIYQHTQPYDYRLKK